MSAAIQTAGLTKRYGDRTALRGTDLQIPSGGITGLLGPNGAGKTTLVKLLLGLARPTAGSAAIFGLDVVRDSIAVRRVTAFVPEERAILPRMRVSDFLDGTREASVEWDSLLATRLLRRWEIPAAMRLGTLSTGTRSRLLIAAALARRPRLLLLDEATAGLDPAAVDDTLGEIAAAAADGTTVLLVTHRLEEVERICDRVAVLHRGRVLLEGDLDDIRASWCAIEVVRHPPVSRLREWQEVARVTIRGDVALLLVRSDPEAVRHRLHVVGGDVLTTRPLTLREIYLAQTSDGEPDAARSDLA